MPALLCVIFFLSGAAALLFETLWFHQAGLALGNSIWASSVVLAGFMGGLALGNGMAGRVGHRIARPLLAYAGLELAIGGAGIGLVYGLPQLGPWLAPVLRTFLELPVAVHAIRLVVAFGVLLVPSVAMGATLPLLVGELVRREPRFGRALGRLYGWNTLGAVAGAIGGEAALFAWLGIHGSALAAGAVNVVVALLAVGLDRWAVPHPSAPGALSGGPAPAGPPLPRRALVLLAAACLCGGVLLALEVVWFRFLILFTLPGSLAFALMLAVVLAGIGVGGLCAARLLAFIPGAERSLPALLASSGLLCLAGYVGFDPLLRVLAAGTALDSGWKTVAVHGLFLMFPVAALSGALFALLGEALDREAPAAVRSTGLLTLANTTGAMLGSLAGGFVLLPFLGIERSVRLLAGVYAAVALLVAVAGWRPQRIRGQAVALVLGAGLLAWIGPLFPSGLMHRRYLTYALQSYAAAGERPVAVRETLTETLVYTRADILGRLRHYRLVTNSHSMSTTSFQAQRYMRLFVYLPLALHPDPKQALLISYGVGVTAKALTDTKSLERIDVVDISRDILDINRIAWEDAKEYPLADPRVHVHIEDGRQFLQTTDRRFDLITGEPPPPKAASVVNLYTREFFALARGRLQPGGLFSYWLPVHLLSEAEAKAILRAFCDVFEDCSLWSGAGLNLIMLGSNEASGPGSTERFGRQWRDPVVSSSLRDLGLELPEQLGATFMADATDLREMIRGIEPLVDDRPKRLGQTGYDMASQVDLYRGWLDPELLRRRFERSPWVRALWPAELREATLPYFRLQPRIEDYFFEGVAAPRRPSVDLPRVDRVLRASPLSTLALWEMRTNVDIQRPILQGGSRGAAGQVHAMTEFEAGARLLADRRPLEAAARFAASHRALPTDRTALSYQIYALCLAGRRPEAEAFAAREGMTSSADSEDRAVWNFVSGHCQPLAPAGAGPP